MEDSIGSLLLSQLYGFKKIDTNKCRDLLVDAIKENKYVTPELAELIGCDARYVDNAIRGLKEVIVKQAKENGVSIEELVDNLFKG